MMMCGAPMAGAARRRGYTPHGIADVRAPSNAPSDEGMMRPRSEEVRRGWYVYSAGLWQPHASI